MILRQNKFTQHLIFSNAMLIYLTRPRDSAVKLAHAHTNCPPILGTSFPGSGTFKPLYILLYANRLAHGLGIVY